MALNKQQMREYQNIRRYNLRLNLVLYLGGVCVACGKSNELEFDHKDPSTKLFTIASGLDKPHSILYAEVDKCQLLCKSDHNKKTFLEHNPNGVWNKGNLTHGSSCYRNGCRCDEALKWNAKRNVKRRINFN